ncbi:aminodeoxychorismate lyase [Pseudoalteromonas 'SMAR']|uniref:aminodeoxychorismate lyase n=1 Tax=Pseudoalteromonas 'SMAR' TaxID=3416908 RepID=UPI003AF2516F
MQQQTQFPANDRGLSYGDGFFTTALIKNGKAQLWPFHRARLLECQQRLGFPALPWQQLEQQLAEATAGIAQGVIKILITRGVGGRGYQAPERATPVFNLQTFDYPEHYLRWQQQGISLAMSNIKLGLQPLLAGLKTLNRLEQVLVKQDAQQFSEEDVVVANINDHIIEASAANLIFIKQGNIYTPDLSLCGIRGVYLDYLSSQLNIHSQNVNLAELKQADAIYLCNSLMALVPVQRLQEKTFDIAKTRQLQQQFLQVKA